MELEVYQAFTKACVSEADAKAVAESINKAIDQRYALHAEALATRGDILEVRKQMAEMEARLGRAISDMQRWTITAMFAGIATSAAIAKFIHP